MFFFHRKRKNEEQRKEIIKNNRHDIFSDIIGHESLKTIFRNALNSDEQVHILLIGAAGTGKSLFLESIANKVKHSYFITSNSTGAGILKYLYEHSDLRFLLIDEIEKLKKDEVAVLLTLMESGRLIITKKTMMINRKQTVTVFATCNDLNRLAPEMISRFLRFTIKPYTFFEFIQITHNIVVKRFKRSPEFAEKVGKAVWEEMGSRDIRDVIKVTRLTKKDEEIDIIIKALAYYSDESKDDDEETYDGEEIGEL